MTIIYQTSLFVSYIVKWILKPEHWVGIEFPLTVHHFWIGLSWISHGFVDNIPRETFPMSFTVYHGHNILSIKYFDLCIYNNFFLNISFCVLIVPKSIERSGSSTKYPLHRQLVGFIIIYIWKLWTAGFYNEIMINEHFERIFRVFMICCKYFC